MYMYMHMYMHMYMLYMCMRSSEKVIPRSSRNRQEAVTDYCNRSFKGGRRSPDGDAERRRHTSEIRHTATTHSDTHRRQTPTEPGRRPGPPDPRSFPDPADRPPCNMLAHSSTSPVVVDRSELTNRTEQSTS